MWADNGWGPKHVFQPGSGLHKRVSSIKCLHQMAESHPEHICVLFRITGKRISDFKKMSYPDNVRV